MSRRAITLILLIKGGARRAESDTVSRNTPSTRKRTATFSSNGSTWTSEAPMRTASAMSPLMRRMIGASLALSSKSSVLGISEMISERLASPSSALCWFMEAARPSKA